MDTETSNMIRKYARNIALTAAATGRDYGLTRIGVRDFDYEQIGRAVRDENRPGPRRHRRRVGHVDHVEAVGSREQVHQFGDMTFTPPAADDGVPAGHELRHQRPPQPAGGAGEDDEFGHGVASA